MQYTIGIVVPGPLVTNRSTSNEIVAINVLKIEYKVVKIDVI